MEARPVIAGLHLTADPKAHLLNSRNLPIYTGDVGGCKVLLAVTGVGAVNTALHLNELRIRSGQLVQPTIQLGIAGSFDSETPLAKDVYEVIEDSYADFGAHTPAGFCDLQTLGFVNFAYSIERPEVWQIPENDREFWGTYRPPAPTVFYNTLANPHRLSLGLQQVSSLTVQAVSGDAASIARVRGHWPAAQLESMEGAAFFQVNSVYPSRYHQLRTVSNHVEPRDPSRWRVKPAIALLGEFAVELVRGGGWK